VVEVLAARGRGHGRRVLLADKNVTSFDARTRARRRHRIHSRRPAWHRPVLNYSVADN